jgi:hypothetical protein
VQVLNQFLAKSDGKDKLTATIQVHTSDMADSAYLSAANTVVCCAPVCVHVPGNSRFDQHQEDSVVCHSGTQNLPRAESKSLVAPAIVTQR